MTYQSYKRDKADSFDVQPYCVKLFRQRWYMIGRCTDPDYDKLMIYALDRIFSLHTTNETFKLPKNWDAQKHFNGCFGIFANKEVRIQNIKLKVNATQANYIRDLELHESQEEIEWNEEYSIFTYRLRPTFDFIQELLWNGADLEVLEPKDLRQEMANIVEQMHKIYKK